MKILLKKVNRGVILTLLCLAILTTYVIYDYVSYNLSKENLTELATECVTATFDINSLLQNKSDENKNTALNTINKYWCSGATTLDTESYTVASKKSQKEDIASAFSSDNTDVYSTLDFETGTCHVKKSSTAFAQVDVEVFMHSDINDDYKVFTPTGIKDSIDSYYSYTIEFKRNFGKWEVVAITESSNVDQYSIF